MRVKEVTICKKPELMIYMTQQEYEDASVQDNINEYKKKCKNISIFVSGTHSITETLTKIVQEYSK